MESINSQSAPDPVGAYPHARKVGSLVFLSGVGPREPKTNRIPGLELGPDGSILKYDFALQCHSVFRNVRQILMDAGSRWERLIDVTVFLTDLKTDFDVYNRIYGEYFKSNQPCRTTVGIDRLPTPIAIELKCIATVD